MDTLQHVSTVFANEPQAALAKRIAGITPGGKLTKSFFTNSGTEANETAILAARCYTGTHRNRRAAAQLSRPLRPGDGRYRPRRRGGWAAPRRPASSTRINAYCYRCPFGAHLPKLQRPLRPRSGGYDPHLDLRPHRGLHRRADPGRRRLHHSAQGIFRDRRTASSRNSAASSSATKCRPAGAAPAANGSASNNRRRCPTSSPAPRAWATAHPSA